MKKIAEEASHKLMVSVSRNGIHLADVICEVFLPHRVAGPLELRLKPTLEQSKIFHNLFEFSIEGEIMGFDGALETVISGKSVYNLGHSTKYWGVDVSETVLIAEPADLKVTQHLGNSQDSTTPKGVFWLTPCVFFPVRNHRILSYTGAVSIERRITSSFNLDNRLRLIFDHYFRYLSKEHGATESFPELIAEFERESDDVTMNAAVEALDDFLMLTSFAARQRCVCLGWETHDASHSSKTFRRDITIPTATQNHAYTDTLISSVDYEKYIGTVYRNFSRSNSKELTRQAIWGAAVQPDSFVESQFLSLYASLETLVNSFRHDNCMEYVLPQANWKEVKRGIMKFLKNDTHLTDAKTRRLMYDKLEELNRISFPAAFTLFCEYYKINLDDLWPVVDRTAGIALCDVRNRLIHGATFNRLQERALSTATTHLRWIVERSILTVLGWPYGESNVCICSLSRTMTRHQQWHNDRQLFSL